MNEEVKIEDVLNEVQGEVTSNACENGEKEQLSSRPEEVSSEETGKKDELDKSSDESTEVIIGVIEDLRNEFKEKLLVDQHKDQLIDKLHDEVVRYQNGVVNKVVDTMAIDIIQLADNVRKTRAVYAEKEPNAENFTKLLRVVEGLYEDLQDILYRQGIEPYTVDGYDVDARRQTIIASIPTDDEGKHNKIAVRTAEGYERRMDQSLEGKGSKFLNINLKQSLTTNNGIYWQNGTYFEHEDLTNIFTKKLNPNYS